MFDAASRQGKMTRSSGATASPTSHVARELLNCPQEPVRLCESDST